MFDHIADPDVRREAERLRRRELVRRDADFERRRRAAYDSVPVTADPTDLSSDAAIERAAANVVASRRAWRKTPEGRFVLALNDVRCALDRAAKAEDAARAAQNRDFTGERETCERWAGALCDAARDLKSAALDAQLAAMDAPKAKTLFAGSAVAGIPSLGRTRAGNDMHIHRPKLPQSLREFAAEIEIIVLGIVIALAFEQAIEALHRNHEAGEAREGIRSELAVDLGQMMTRARFDDCTRTRLDEIDDLMRRWSDGAPIRAPVWIGRPTTWEMHFSAYRASSSNGRTALLPTEEQSAYAAVYAHIQTFLEAQERERPAWARLQALESLPKYNAVLASELLLSLQEAKYDRARASSAIRQALRDVRGLDIQPKTAGPMSIMGTPPACIPMNTDRAKALDLFYGKGDRSSEP